MNIEPIPKQAIWRSLELIEGCNEKIKLLRSRGAAEDGLELKQEKHLRKGYLRELRSLLQKAQLVE